MCECVTGWEVGQSQEKNGFTVWESQFKDNICSIDYCCGKNVLALFLLVKCTGLKTYIFS